MTGFRGAPVMGREKPARSLHAAATYPTSAQNDLSATVVRDLAGLLALKAPWAVLFEEVASASATLTPIYAETAWRIVASRNGALRIIAIRRGARLVCVWPLYVRREGLIQVARHLGRGSDEEYAGPLVVADGPGDLALRLALDVAKQQADVLRIFNIRRPSALAALLDDGATPRHRQEMIAPVLTAEGFPSLEAWLKTKSSNFRKGLRRDRRRLAETGDLRLQRMICPADVAAVVGWLFDRKLALVTDNGVPGSWICRPESRWFFESLLNEPETDSHASVFALTLDGAIVSAAILYVTSYMELVMLAYADQHAAQSPGHLMLESAVRLALGRGVDCDFRFGPVPYKLRWSDRLDTRATYALATTPYGIPTLWSETVSSIVKAGRRLAGAWVRRHVRSRA